LARGIKRGLLPPDLDIEAGISLLLGPVLYTHIFQKERLARAPDIGPKAAEAFWRAHYLGGPTPPLKPTKRRQNPGGP
jgi:hypothetical protein